MDPARGPTKGSMSLLLGTAGRGGWCYANALPVGGGRVRMYGPQEDKEFGEFLLRDRHGLISRREK